MIVARIETRPKVPVGSLRRGDVFWTCLTGRRGCVIEGWKTQHRRRVTVSLAGQARGLAPGVLVYARRPRG